MLPLMWSARPMSSSRTTTWNQLSTFLSHHHLSSNGPQTIT
jgi:hypothetical protein